MDSSESHGLVNIKRLICHVKDLYSIAASSIWYDKAQWTRQSHDEDEIDPVYYVISFRVDITLYCNCIYILSGHHYSDSLLHTTYVEQYVVMTMSKRMTSISLVPPAPQPSSIDIHCSILIAPCVARVTLMLYYQLHLISTLSHIRPFCLPIFIIQLWISKCRVLCMIIFNANDKATHQIFVMATMFSLIVAIRCHRAMAG